MPTPDSSPASSLTTHEVHQRALGLPLAIALTSRRREVLTRSAGVGAGPAVAFTGLAAVDWSNDYMIALLDRAGPGEVAAGPHPGGAVRHARVPVLRDPRVDSRPRDPRDPVNAAPS